VRRDNSRENRVTVCEIEVEPVFEAVRRKRVRYAHEAVLVVRKFLERDTADKA
jgi:hypothetical protein